MPKRKIDASNGLAHLPKRRRIGHLVRIDHISDELVLRILSYLTPDELGLTARVCRRLLRLANDNESWKQRYYARWVRPRVLQIPSTTPRSARDIPRYSAKLANWLDHRHLVFPSKITDWKWQYRIRNNWHRGICSVQALEVSQPPAAPMIIRIHEGIVFEAASTGLRAWTDTKASKSLASKPFALDNHHSTIPTAMTVDSSSEVLRIGIGFSDSSFRCYEFSEASGFIQYGANQHFLDHMEPVSALTMHFPFVFAHIGSTNFLLKRLDPNGSLEFSLWEELAWLQAGRRHECSPSLALRRVGKEIAASIAYTSELVGGTNWCLGIQEVRVPDKSVIAPKTGPLVALNSGSLSNKPREELHSQTRTLDAWTPAFPMHPTVDSRPKVLSYSHPYLLAALPDNTMMVYLVTSTSEKLSLSDGSRLWGNTSGISGVSMNARGKAVTTSTKGGEVRVWDLEGLARGISQEKTSIPLAPTQRPGFTPSPLSSSLSANDGEKSKLDHDQLAFLRSWIAFDDEQVLVLGEGRHERTLARYDFTK